MKRILATTFTFVAAVAGFVLPASSAQAANLDVCAGQVPNGYVVINNYWSPSTCGNPTTIVYNVWVVTSYFDKPVGSNLNVCDSARISSGWAFSSSWWSATTCNPAPTDPAFHNVKRIVRVS